MNAQNSAEDGQLKPTAYSYTIKLIDFGNIAHHYEEPKSRGTLAYMAPELTSQTLYKIGSKADIFALGAILFNMTSLQRPFEEANQNDNKF